MGWTTHLDCPQAPTDAGTVARLSLRPCLAPGCRELVPRGRCRKHAVDERVRQHDVNARRDPAAVRPYQTPRWREARARFLARFPWCACGARARYVDHIKPWRSMPTHDEREAAFWNEGNWSPKCGPCHSRKTAACDGGFGNPRRSE